MVRLVDDPEHLRELVQTDILRCSWEGSSWTQTTPACAARSEATIREENEQAVQRGVGCWCARKGGAPCEPSWSRQSRGPIGRRTCVPSSPRTYSSTAPPRPSRCRFRSHSRASHEGNCVVPRHPQLVFGCHSPCFALLSGRSHALFSLVCEIADRRSRRGEVRQGSRVRGSTPLGSLESSMSVPNIESSCVRGYPNTRANIDHHCGK